jgi:hypothetical protein
MKFTIRRVAVLACSIALNVFFVLSPPATATVSAARCQQECEAEYGSGGSCVPECDYQYYNQTGGGVSYDDWQACRTQCNSYYTSCSMSAVNCNYPNDCYYAFCYSDAHEPYEPIVTHCESFPCS